MHRQEHENRSWLRRQLLAGGLLSGVGALSEGLISPASRFVWAATNDLFMQIPYLTPEITSNAAFYKVSKNLLPPNIRPEQWSLQVTGAVRRPFNLHYVDLPGFSATQHYITLACISNKPGGQLMSTALWKGFLLRQLLERAGVQDDAVEVVFRAADGYGETLPLATCLDHGTLLAYEMNGVLLPPDHGFPLRLVVPNVYGLKSIKWLTGIEVVRTDTPQGYWEKRGWSDTAVVQVQSRIDQMTLPRALKAGQRCIFGGIAFAGSRGIQQVEVSTDTGRTWQPAAVKPALSPYTWQLWAFPWTPLQQGRYVLQVRASDTQGTLQRTERSKAAHDGTSGFHMLKVRVNA